MHSQKLRAKQPLFLRRDRSKVNRVRRPHRRLRKRPRQFQHDAASRSIVGSAVVNVVSLGIRVNAQMIVVGRV